MRYSAAMMTAAMFLRDKSMFIRVTRNNTISIERPRLKLEISKRIFYFAGAKIFNSLPMEIRPTKYFTNLGHLFFDHFQS